MKAQRPGLVDSDVFLSRSARRQDAVQEHVLVQAHTEKPWEDRQPGGHVCAGLGGS